MAKQKHYVIALKNVEVDVICRRKRDVMTRVYSDGRVRVSAPIWFSEAKAQAFVREHQEEILAQLARYTLSPQETAYREALRHLDEGDVVPWWGQDTPIILEDSDAWCLAYDPGTLTFQLPKEHLSASDAARYTRRAIFEEFAKSQIQAVIARYRPICERDFGVTTNHWTIRKMRSRWGSCRPETGNFSINLDLATHKPDHLFNVIIHEMCHMLVPNHGPAFQELMDEHSSDWRKLDRELKAEGVRLSRNP